MKSDRPTTIEDTSKIFRKGEETERKEDKNEKAKQSSEVENSDPIIPKAKKGFIVGLQKPQGNQTILQFLQNKTEKPSKIIEGTSPLYPGPGEKTKPITSNLDFRNGFSRYQLLRETSRQERCAEQKPDS